MLRIITKQRGSGYRLELHGNLAGEWIAILETHWREIVDRTPTAVVIVGLSNVVFIDSSGEQLLRRMSQRGVAIEGDGPMNRYVIRKLLGGL